MLVTLALDYDAPEPAPPGYCVSPKALDEFGTWTTEQKARAVEAELRSGRCAMLAVTCYAFEEAFFQQPIAHLF